MQAQLPAQLQSQLTLGLLQQSGSRRSRLMAQWQRVDDKLVCQWMMVED